MLFTLKKNPVLLVLTKRDFFYLDDNQVVGLK
jgi:hypothetical protein